jgi:hypothetical protein
MNKDEVNKAMLLEILLNPNYVEEYVNYKWREKYKQHMSDAGLLHYKKYIKYGVGGSYVKPNYVITDLGRKYLEKKNS